MTEHIIQDTMESWEDHFIKDQWGREYHFKIGAFPYPTGPFVEAVKATLDSAPDPQRYEVWNVRSDAEKISEIASVSLKLVHL
jgi:hypothetical protein